MIVFWNLTPTYPDIMRCFNEVECWKNTTTALQNSLYLIGSRLALRVDFRGLGTNSWRPLHTVASVGGSVRNYVPT